MPILIWLLLALQSQVDPCQNTAHQQVVLAGAQEGDVRVLGRESFFLLVPILVSFELEKLLDSEQALVQNCRFKASDQWQKDASANENQIEQAFVSLDRRRGQPLELEGRQDY